MKRALSAVLCILTVGGALAAPATARRSATATRGAPDAIDGDLGDPVWSRADWHTGFSRLDRVHEQAAPQTRFKTAFDDGRLHFAVECFEPELDKIRAECTERDSGVWGDDCVEVFLSLAEDTRRYVHIVVNSRGVIADGAYNEDGGRSSAWNCAGEAAARTRAGSWTVELSIPFHQLQVTPKPDNCWAFNVARERKVAGSELSSFAAIDLLPFAFSNAVLYSEASSSSTVFTRSEPN